MKILIYGDSNVCSCDNFIFGKNHWVKILKNNLQNFTIIDNGVLERVAGDIDKDILKNGKRTFLDVFKLYAPVDMIIIMLGTNDLQKKYNRSSEEILQDLIWYKEVLEDAYIDLDKRQKFFNERLPKFIFITPVKFDYKDRVKEYFNRKSFNNYKELKLAMKKSFGNVIDISGLASIDGMNLDIDAHISLATMVEKIILENQKN